MLLSRALHAGYVRQEDQLGVAAGSRVRYGRWLSDNDVDVGMPAFGSMWQQAAVASGTGCRVVERAGA